MHLLDHREEEVEMNWKQNIAAIEEFIETNTEQGELFSAGVLVRNLSLSYDDVMEALNIMVEEGDLWRLKPFFRLPSTPQHYYMLPLATEDY